MTVHTELWMRGVEQDYTERSRRIGNHWTLFSRLHKQVIVEIQVITNLSNRWGAECCRTRWGKKAKLHWCDQYYYILLKFSHSHMIISHDWLTQLHTTLSCITYTTGAVAHRLCLYMFGTYWLICNLGLEHSTGSWLLITPQDLISWISKQDPIGLISNWMVELRLGFCQGFSRESLADGFFHTIPKCVLVWMGLVRGLEGCQPYYIMRGD